MKQFIFSILITLYLTVSVGAVMNVHYCMDTLSRIDFWDISDTCSACGDESLESDCCSDELHIFQLDMEQNVQPEINVNMQPVVLEVLFDLLGYLIPQEVSHIAPIVIRERPPGLSEVPLFIHHCTYLI